MTRNRRFEGVMLVTLFIPLPTITFHNTYEGDKFT